MTQLFERTAKRLFSLNLFKNRKLPLGEMSFSKDFVNEKRGDIYPTLESSGDFSEHIAGGKYFFRAQNADAFTTRLVGRHFPYATYEMTVQTQEGKCGFVFNAPCGKVSVAAVVSDGTVEFSLTENGTVYVHPTKIDCCPRQTFIVTTRCDCFDIYMKNDGYPEYICTFAAKSFADIHREDIFTNSTAAVCFSGNVTVSEVSFYIDCGLSQADIRPVCYENGEILSENGVIFLTATIRLQAGSIQGVFTWVPGTSDIDLCGALFFNTGDGYWCGDVATSLKFDRRKNMWYLWVCSFSHGHILGHAEFDGDVRYGVNVIDITLMDTKEHSDDCDFWGKQGDEDPDIIYDEKNDKWYMSVCRVANDGGEGKYRYFFFESDNPFTGFRHIGHTKCGADTGGSLLNIDGEFYFACGSCFDKRADYRVYSLSDFDNYTPLKFDYDDGGFRGWGTIICVKRGLRKKYYHLTFDRANASDYNWSYGNIYCFEIM